MSAHAPLNVAHFLSLFLTALCLGPALAHLAALVALILSLLARTRAQA